MALRRYRRLIIGLLLLYFLAAVSLAFRLPALATPNELLNYEYIQVMRQIRGLPNRGLVDSEIRYTEWHQPPLYFTFAALFGLPIPVPPSDVNPPPPIIVQENPHYLSTPNGNLNPVVHVTPQTMPLLYAGRVAAALLGLLGVAALYRAGSRIYHPWVGLLMASLMAFQPSYLHLSGSVNNDMPLTAVIAVAMSYALLLLHRQEHQRNRPPSLWAYLVLGLMTVAAIMTKANGVFSLAFPAVVLLSHLIVYRRPMRTLASGAAVLAGLLPLWLGWLRLNTVRMGDTLGLSGSLPVGRVLALSPLDFGHVAPFLPAVWRSYWLDWSAGDVGYGPTWLYIFWLVALLFMLAGWLRRDTRDERRDTSSERRATFVSRISYLVSSPSVSLVTLLVVLGFLGISYLYFAVKALTVKEAGWMVPEARWWLPGLAPLAWLAAAGFARWWRDPRRQERACLIASAVPPIIAYGLLAWHLPALYPQAERIAAVPESNLFVYDDTLALIDADAPSMTAGEATDMMLTWQALRNPAEDYTITAQLIIHGPDGWRKVAEHNSYPGLGMNPTSDWRAGEVYRDHITLLPAGELNGPTLAAIHIGAQSANGNAAAMRDGQPVDPAVAATVVVRPAERLTVPAPLTDPVQFGESLQLIGAMLDRSGEQVRVTFYWEALETMSSDFTVFVHLLDADGRMLDQADSAPNRGLSPTTIWEKGDIIRDEHTFAVGQAVPAGGRIVAGVYDPVTGMRLPAIVAGERLPDDAFVLIQE